MEIFPLVSRNRYKSDYDYYRAIIAEQPDGREFIENYENGFSLGSQNDFHRSLKLSEDKLRKIRARRKGCKLGRKKPS